MNFFTSRRAFLGTCATIPLMSGTVSIAENDSSGVRPDISSIHPNDPYIQTLRDAVAELKRRDAAHGRAALNGWRAVASSHKFWCFNGALPEEFEIHFSWTFLPWHRAYLQRIERALQSAVREPSLRIPYWNWSVNRRVPEVFSQPFYNKNGVQAENPLFNHTRFGSVGQGGEVDIYSDEDITSVGDFQRFGGQHPLTGGRGMGTLESGPHNKIHVQVGYQEPNGPLGDMADDLSSIDPIFMAHHANIDRLWSIWRKKWPGRDPVDSVWQDRRFALIDYETLEFEVYTTSELLDTNKLPSPYRYQNEGVLFLSSPVLAQARIEGKAFEGIIAPVNRDSARFRFDLSPRGADVLRATASRGSATIVLDGITLSDRPRVLSVHIFVPATGQTIPVGEVTTLPVRGAIVGRTVRSHVVIPPDIADRINQGPSLDIVVRDITTGQLNDSIRVGIER